MKVCIVFIHEVLVVPVLNFISSVTENPAEGVVKKQKIAFEAGFIETVLHIFDENTVPFLPGPGAFTADHRLADRIFG